MSIKISIFGILPNGKIVNEYCLKNKNGMEVRVINYGGIITSIRVPDKDGIFENVVLAYSCLDDYIQDNCYLGALIGRYANRIANASFSLDGKEFHLVTNLGENNLHGGSNGFHKVFWEIESLEQPGLDRLNLHYLNKDGEGGFPGNLDVNVQYSLTEQNELIVEYSAISDKKTVFNPTQHTYFNLSGNPTQQICGHQLMVNAGGFLSTDEFLIPDGKIIPVEGSPMDFRQSKQIGMEIQSDYDPLKIGNGYDHCWVLDKDAEVTKAAELIDPVSKRKLEIFTSELGIQFYTGNYLKAYHGEFGYRCGVGLETQHFPDSPNKTEFPSVILDAGKIFYSATTYCFSLSEK